MIRSGDKSIIPENVTNPSEEGSESKGTTNPVVIITIVVSASIVVIVALVIISCLIKRNRKSTSDGLNVVG
jgi:heme/copper-type cytochrome/quinol oxidase subunit 2